MNVRIHLLALLAVLGSGAQLVQAEPARQLPLAEPCFIDGWPNALNCHQVDVADGPEHEKIALSVLVAPALAGSEKEPLYLLAGGPGQAASDLARLLHPLQKINRERDIVLVDRRGAGRSDVFDCGIKAEPPSDPSEFSQLLANCYAQNPERPQTLNSRQAVNDLEQVRVALGHEKISLWGGSWGTRTALLYQQWHPESLQSLVLDGVAPIESKVFLSAQKAEAALQQLQRDCAADAVCAGFGDWRGDMDRLLASWSDIQASNFPDPFTGRRVEQPVEAWMLANAVRAALYDPAAAAQLPFAIHQASSGNLSPLAGIVGLFAQMEGSMAMGLTFSVACAEELNRITPQEIAADGANTFLGDGFIRVFVQGCASWSVPPRPYARSEPRAHPVLLISGSADPITPPQYAEQALGYLQNRQHLIVNGGGHINTPRGCIPDLIRDFLDTPEQPLDAGCVAEIRRPPFMAAAYGPALAVPTLMAQGGDHPDGEHQVADKDSAGKQLADKGDAAQ
ncbi:alpha/beta hydrolase [Microbulbifer bruguierae]|uniref:Proline iminopeptidase n=1 Tax=Microbulbifer bruguierae TaxID=3029061 RepID=A0ABY8NH87_9GAMM|nr:alpha/beta hydrolase [Microbulbifer bruguierae]WGL18296.1 alpha/beta hydrolase [Microbulbifer bruguierae]